MSAASTVLSFRYRVPAPCTAVNPKAHPAVRQAQGVLDRGLHQAEMEMRSAGFDRDTATHLARMVALQVLHAFDGESIQADAVLRGLVDRLDREQWTRRLR